MKTGDLAALSETSRGICPNLPVCEAFHSGQKILTVCLHLVL